MVAATGSALAFPLLSMLVFIPAVGALAVTLMPRRRPEYAKLTAAVASVATGALTVWATQAFDTADDGFQFVSRHPWIEAWGISWHLGVDGISLFLVLLTGLLFPLAILGIDPHNDDPARDKPYFAWLLLLEAGVMGSFISLDLFLFFVFFEIVLVPMYFLIGGWGYEGRVYAATKFFLYTMVGSAFMLVSILATVFIARNNGLGYVTFDLVELANEAEFAASTGRWLFFGFAVAFAVKVPVFPLHTWLPDAHTQAPTAGSVVLAGVLLKMGTYGFIRFGIPLFPGAAVWATPFICWLAVIGIIYGALLAWRQSDIKKLVAYSSVSHLGYVVLGIFLFRTSGESSQLISEGMIGAIIQMVNHGLSTGMLFLLIGIIYERRHTREIDNFGGIAKVMPVYSTFFIIATLSSIGLPGLNGFVGEFLILKGSFTANPLFGALAATGVILGAVYMLMLCRRFLFGPVIHQENAQLPDVSTREVIYLVPLVVMMVWIGLFSKSFTDLISPTVHHYLQNLL